MAQTNFRCVSPLPITEQIIHLRQQIWSSSYIHNLVGLARYAMLKKTAQLDSLLISPGGFVYQRHKPEETELYKIIEQNLPSFQFHLSNADISLPAFVHDEFRSYLRCGLLEHGFLRVKCNGCRFEHLVAFSCKLRGFCRGRPAHPAVHAAWLKHQLT